MAETSTSSVGSLPERSLPPPFPKPATTMHLRLRHHTKIHWTDPDSFCRMWGMNLRCFRFRAAAATDLGQRSNNEDAYLIDERLGLFIVADGMGGHDKGEVASWFSVENLHRLIAESLPSHPSDTLDEISPSSPDHGEEELLQFATFKVNERLYGENLKRQAQLAKQPIGDMPIKDLIRRDRKMGTT